jgi:hypothetical protein
LVGRYLAKIIKATRRHDTDITSQDICIVAQTEIRDKTIPIPQKMSPIEETRLDLLGYSD